MALILNIESTTTSCSVALANNGKILFFKEINEGYTHSENLPKFIEMSLSMSDVMLGELDAIAVSIGPGSYTGLRIGFSLAKGLCFALEIPMLGISTLKAMASNFIGKYPSHLISPMLDARRMEVYFGLYDHNLKEIIKPTALIVNKDYFSDLLTDNKILFAGPGSNKCKPFFQENPNAEFINDVFPSAQFMVGLSEEKFNKKEFESLAYSEPLYLKEFHSNVDLGK